MTITRGNYASTDFPYMTSIPTQGEPSYKALKRLKNELQTNTSSVDSDLGGGDHKYLGLVLIHVVYSRVTPNSPFIALMFPGSLINPWGIDTIDAIDIIEVHKIDIFLYREYREVERDDCEDNEQDTANTVTQLSIHAETLKLLTELQ